MQKERVCKICESHSFHPSWTAKDMRYCLPETFTYFQCIDCGCLQIEDIPNDVVDYYPRSYYSLERVSDKKLFDSPLKGFFRHKVTVLGISNRRSAKIFHKILHFPTQHEWFRYGKVSFDSMILDVGCGSGSLLVRIWKEGFVNTYGIDTFIEADIYYRNGLRIKKAFMNEIEEDSYYNFVMLNHSLEHIPDQFDAFQNLNRLLKVGGTVLIRVPISTSYAWERYGIDWVNLDAPRHLFLHSEKSIQLLADRASLYIENVVYDSLEFQFYGSELCKRGIPLPYHKDYMKKNGKNLFNKTQMSRWKRMCKELNMNKKGDMACFYLRKL